MRGQKSQQSPLHLKAETAPAISYPDQVRWPPSSTHWVLTTALVCALAGLLLKATEPVPLHPPAPRVAMAPPSRAAKPLAANVAPAGLPRDRGHRQPRPSRAPAMAADDSLDDPPAQVVVARDEMWFDAAPPRPAVLLSRVVSPAVAHTPAVDPAVSVKPRTTRPGVRPPVHGKRRRLARLRRAADRTDGGSTGERVFGSPPLVDQVPTPSPPVQPTSNSPAQPPTIATEYPSLDPSAVPSSAPSAVPSSAPSAAPSPPPAPPDAVAFDSGAAVLPTAGQVSIPIPAPDAQEGGSVSLVVQSGWERGNQDDATLVQLGDGLRVAKNVDVLRLETADGGPDIGIPITGWNPGEWHHVAATWKGNDVALYLDGELVGRHTGDVPLDLPPETTLLVGSDDAGRRPVARGLIGRVAVRRGALGDDQVLRDYHDALAGDDRRGSGNVPDDRGNASDGVGDHGLPRSGSDPGSGHEPGRGFAH